MEDRQKTDQNQRAALLTLAASFLATVFCAAELLRIPSDAKNAFLFGLSKERLLMAGLFALLLILNTISFLWKDRILSTIQSHTILRPILQTTAVIALFLLLMPDYRFGKASAYYTRLRPFILWLFLTSFFFTLFTEYISNRFSDIRITLNNLAEGKKYVLITLAVLAAGILFILLTGLGKTVESALWNKNGVPLQSIQLAVCVITLFFFGKSRLVSYIFNNKKVLHFFLIWAAAAFVWSRVPMIHHFFAPGPYPPDQQFFPYSDAISYDLPAQIALNGWGFNFGGLFLKPTVAVVSFWTHLLTGNDNNHSMMLQSALYGILPAIIYLFGSSIGGAVCGFMAAAFSILQEWNALQSSRSLLTINSRLIMSEFLTQILFVTFCYSIFLWLRKKENATLYAIIAGGIFTLGIFTRYNFFAFLPAGLLILIIGYRKDPRQLLKPLIFFFLTIFLTAAPMFFRDSQKDYPMVKEIIHTVRDVLIKQRFKGETPPDPYENTEDGSVFTQSDGNSSNDLENEIFSETAETADDDSNTGQITQFSQNINSNIELPLIPSMINHGLHNLIASAMTLPLDWSFQDLPHLYSQDQYGLWSDNWQGDFSAKQWIAVIFWMIAGALSIGFLIKLHGLAGFSIFYFWFVYAFSIGFSRSSGGRYVVPTNWIPLLLLSFFCTLIFFRGNITISEINKEMGTRWIHLILIAAFTAFFTAVLIFETYMPEKITSISDGDLSVLKERLSEHNEINWDLIEKQEQDGSLHITHGITLYPRYYYFLGGEHTPSGALMRKEYSRMTFYGINSDTDGYISQEYMMPHTEMIDLFPHGSVFRAISCRSAYQYEDVLAVTVETPDGDIYTYTRDPLPEFSCPVPEPVCTSIENCY